MTLTLEINEAVQDQVLWMLNHFKGDLKIVSTDPIEETSKEEAAEILEKLSALSQDERSIDRTGTVELSL